MKALDYEGRRNVSGERVRQTRTERKITQAELAARVQCEGVALEQDAISRIESGQRMVQDYELRPCRSAGREHGLAGRKGIKTMPQDILRHFAYKIQA